MNDYTINGKVFRARNLRTAQRRARGYARGELDLDGKTIKAKDRKPPGQPMRKRKTDG
jgi:hypothetical protein